MGGRGLSESDKKRKFVTKIFFSDNIKEVLKTCEKMVTAMLLLKLIKTARNKISSIFDCILEIFTRSTFET